jgi:glycosyltransferase involved in cell wall biosynthesis
MNILHIAAHMGDGGGKAISGIAIMGSQGDDRHNIMLLEPPRKLNHIERCHNAGIRVFAAKDADIEAEIAEADVVVVNWWGKSAMTSFVQNFPQVPCRIALWAHINGLNWPPLPPEMVNLCECLLATSQVILDNPQFVVPSTLVYGMGDFVPEDMPYKQDYTLRGDTFTIGYVGMPAYNRQPDNFLNYARAVIAKIPNCHFVMAGECSDEFKRDVEQSGISSYFTLTGWTIDVPRILQMFDAFGYLMRPGLLATTENSVIEAQAAGLPMVVSAFPIGKYLLQDGTTGLLADTPDDYACALHELYASENLRERIGRAAREYAIRIYRAGENLERFNTLLQSTLVIGGGIVHKFYEIEELL